MNSASFYVIHVAVWNRDERMWWAYQQILENIPAFKHWIDNMEEDPDAFESFCQLVCDLSASNPGLYSPNLQGL
jgi:hypothetical protein